MALATGARLGVGNDPVYVKTRCFEPFPFPEATDPQRERIRFLGEQLNAHRKRCQEAHPNVTLTEMYNVLEDLRVGRPLDDAAQVVHDHGLVSVLVDLHDKLDVAVADAYGCPDDLCTEDILFRLVELNATRAAEERCGFVRWLRPELQNVTGTQAAIDIELEGEEFRPAPATRQPWPPSLPDRVRLVRDFLLQSSMPIEPNVVARKFIRARSAEVTAILDTLVALGQIKKNEKTYSL